MPLPGSVSRGRLAAMGIELWRRRPSPDETGRGRIRLASGSGDWLLVMSGNVPDHCSALLADVTAAIGRERCRFGHWAGSPDAGVGPEEWDTRGIRNVLVFGSSELPEGEQPAGGRVIQADDPAVLHQHPESRQALWQKLRSRLED